VLPGSVSIMLTFANPVYDILPPPTATVVRAGSSATLDLAPAGGMDVMVVGMVAAVIAAVLVLILRSRSQK
jgi:hypothetical protein